MEPASWWVGMKNTELQILVYGKDISKSKVSLSYPGVRIKEVAKVESPNYLFLYLTVTGSTKPGTMNLVFTSGTEKFVKKRSGVMRYNTDAEVNPAALQFLRKA